MPQEITAELDNKLIFTTAHGFDEDKKFEIIDGAEVEVAIAKWFHNSVAGAIYMVIRWYIRLNNLDDRVFENGLLIDVDDECEALPDVVLVSDKNNLDGSHYHGVPELVVEVISPSTEKIDLNKKRVKYAQLGIPEYWTVHPLDKKITVWYNEDGEFVIDAVYQIPNSPYIKPDDPDYITSIKTKYYGDELIFDLKDIFEWL
ncbi:MAG: Uma2 family endonuclease [Oscillospiraceae bacterium]|jgi:Uma2 family endonuclease|nr:Uma2 family endonuclease [Oscillospiraceae bacterium]